MNIWSRLHKAPVRVIRINNKRSKIKLRRTLLTIKMALAQEKLETRDMLLTYRAYTRGKADKEQLRRANEQFRDILKGVGLGVVAILPFAPITIPVVIKIGKWVGVDILPSAFYTESTGKNAEEVVIDTLVEQVTVEQVTVEHVVVEPTQADSTTDLNADDQTAVRADQQPEPSDLERTSTDARKTHAK